MQHNQSMKAGTIELPATMIEPAKLDLANRMRVAVADVQVLRAVPVIWNNGAAGCPKPGVDYTQATVAGYWVVLGYRGKRYSYHARQNGPLRLCDLASVDPLGPPPHGKYNDAV